MEDGPASGMSSGDTECVESASFPVSLMLVDKKESSGMSERSTEVTELRLSTRGLFLARFQSELSDSRLGGEEACALEDGCR